MPFYDFYCDDCGEVFEEYFNVEDERVNLQCPSCGSKSIMRDFSSVSCKSGKNKSSRNDDKDSSCGFTSFG